MKANRKTVVNSDTGANDLNSSPGRKNTATVVEPNTATDSSSGRHRVTFMDEVTGDKK